MIVKDVVVDLLMIVTEILLAVQTSTRCVLRFFRGFAEVAWVDDVEWLRETRSLLELIPHPIQSIEPREDEITLH